MSGGVVAPGHGRQLAIGASRPTVKVGPHTGSSLIGVLESEIPPGGGFPGHVHDEYEEVFYVLDGEIEYLVGAEWTSAPPGSTIFVPAGSRHGFRNRADRPARHLAIASPATAMTMIEELARAQPTDFPAVLAKYRSALSP